MKPLCRLCAKSPLPGEVKLKPRGSFMVFAIGHCLSRPMQASDAISSSSRSPNPTPGNLWRGFCLSQ